MRIFFVFLVILSILYFLYSGEYFHLPSGRKFHISHRSQLEEYKNLFASHEVHLETVKVDVDEIDGDPLQVIANKASLLQENTMIEDASLDIEGVSVGINIRWFLRNLHQYLGHKAIWTVYLAYRHDGQVYIYKGSVPGAIVTPRENNGLGFESYFLPDGAVETLAQSKPDAFNARAKAVENLMNGNLWTTYPSSEL